MAGSTVVDLQGSRSLTSIGLSTGQFWTRMAFYMRGAELYEKGRVVRNRCQPGSRAVSVANRREKKGPPGMPAGPESGQEVVVR